MIFSCYRASRLTFDRLERPLSIFERISLQGHRFICRHCRYHGWQVRGLETLINTKQRSAREPVSAPEQSLPSSATTRRLPDAARAQIRERLAQRFPSP